jgi:hypothetical protein
MATFTYTLSNAENVSVDQLVLDVKSEFNAFKARHDNDETVVAAAVKSLFDTYRGAGLNASYIQGQIISALNVPPNADKEMRARIASYMKANTAVKETGLTPSGGTPLFVNSKGRVDGGSRRVSDIPAPAAPAV